jgi:hypothetical protein
MAEKLRVRFKESTLKKLRGFALVRNIALESVVDAAIMRWIEHWPGQSTAGKRIDAILPCGEDALGYLKDAVFERRTNLTRAAEEAVEDYLAKNFQDSATGGVEPEKPTFDPKPEPESDARECHCTACGHTWTPKGKGQPAYCPKCSSKEWDKVVICENSCDRPIAPLNTKAGSSNMCEPCYAEMIASWGPEATE